MFDRHQIQKNDDNGYTVTLYLKNRREELSTEPGNTQDGERLERNVRRYVQEKFPDLKVTTAKVMMGTILLSTIPMVTAAPTEAASIQITFTDLKGSYAKRQINELHAAQVILGYPDGTFRPSGNMSREEFAVVLAKALRLEIDPDATTPFTDVSEWAAPYISALEKAGLASGRTDQFFDAAAPVTREEMATFTIRALGLGDQARVLNAKPNFTDGEQIASWARPYVALAHEIGLLSGIPDEDGIRFDPSSDAQRQQVAVLAHRLFRGHADYTERGHAYLDEQGAQVLNTVHINVINQNEYTIEGTGRIGNTVTLTLSDGTTTRTLTAAVGEDRLYRVVADFTPFRDGNIDVKALHRDADGNVLGGVTVTMYKDTVIDPPVLQEPRPITRANQRNYQIPGKAEPGSTIRVFVGAASNVEAALSTSTRADALGQFSATVDASGLYDGDVIVWAEQTDPAGNRSFVSSTFTVSKDAPTR